MKGSFGEPMALQRLSSPFTHLSFSESKLCGPLDSNQAGQQMESDKLLLYNDEFTLDLENG